MNQRFVCEKQETQTCRGMDVSSVTVSTVALSLVTLTLLIWTWQMLNRFWLRPKKLERLLRQQGLQGNSYKFLVGDAKLLMKMIKEAKSKPIHISEDIVPRVLPLPHLSVQKYGKNGFTWLGTIPMVTIMDPEKVKHILTKMRDFPKHKHPVVKLIGTGVANYEGEKWAKHRKIIDPIFNLEKIKLMLPTFYNSCIDMVGQWEEMASANGSCELDVWPFLVNLSRDVISRSAFGSSYEEGRRIFELLEELIEVVFKGIQSIPLLRYLPTASNRRTKAMATEIEQLLKGIIKKKEKAMKDGKASKNDLLSTLLESNRKIIEEDGKGEDSGMSISDVLEECKLFYIAGQETVSSLLVWTMVLLSRYPNWQEQARDEVVQVLGNQKPDFKGLNNLKIVTMILYEVLRLYSPLISVSRVVHKKTQLGELSLPAGVGVSMPILMIHRDPKIWGDDAKEFNPGRFSEGVVKATKGQNAFFPFGWGPRICIGQNFGLQEAKMVLSVILQRFSFELSSSYTHAPTSLFFLYPQHGAHLVLHKL
uniref:Cytochrome P450 n=1 Tax=Polygala tenuifolia TaxID=355332 RepID=A0A1Z2WUY8_9FABA|nr:cytochrome P450 CYP72A548 [Polygala tenuifolia]BBE15471.1 cytochrome P450 [Polygala tenuifolia]